ncbi:Fcf1-domain-containing protein [Xylariomycetidae sp. FL2044]|nr:Fcf1-domain-containing protein [Xylariomycetidae sp. FL2044]
MPRAKRSKQYRKLMEQYSMGFGFREPYQVLVDANLIAEANKNKMDLVKRLEDTVHGQVKPMITQCSIRHLYSRKNEGPHIQAAIEQAKNQFERRRCGHHPDQYPTPLSTMDCLMSVVDPKDAGVNKFHYTCAINDDAVRASLRQIPGVPLIYIRRSVMIMEPMATVTAKARSHDERQKFRQELRTPAKRKREEDNSEDEDDEASKDPKEAATPEKKDKKKKKVFGKKQPNPLSVKKKQGPKTTTKDTSEGAVPDGASEEGPKKKRRRKHKIKADDTVSVSEQQKVGSGEH